MKRTRATLEVLLLIALLGIPDLPASQDLETSIELYRTEGASVALDSFENLFLEFSSNDDRPNAARAERYIGECHWRMGQFDQARAHLESALSSMRTLGLRLEEAKVLNVLGLLEWDLGHYDEAILNFRAASKIGAELGDLRVAGSTMNNLSLVYDELGDYTTSLAQYERALELYQGIDFPRGESDTLGNIGGVNLLLGRFSEALGYYQRALEISERLESKTSMSLDHGNLGYALLGLGRVDESIAHFDRAIDLAIEAGMPKERALWERGKGNAYIQVGKYDEGLVHHRVALETYQQIRARGLLLDALGDLGSLYLTLGDPVSAEAHFQNGVDIAREIGHARGLTINLISLGDVRFHHEQFGKAEDFYREAADRARTAGESNLVIQAALRLSAVHRRTSRFSEADQQAHEALVMAEAASANYAIAESWFALGESARERGEAESALGFYASAEAAPHDFPDPQIQWQTHYGKARSYLQLDQGQAALSELKSAVRLIESVRERLKEERFRAGFIQDKHQVYVDLVRLQLELGFTGDAFSTAERLRSRSFLERLEERGPVSGSKSDRETEIALRERVRALQRALRDETSLDSTEMRQLAVDSFSSELLIAEREYQAFLDDLQANNKVMQAASVPSLVKVQSHLNRDEALVEYVVGQHGVVVFIVKSDSLSALRQEVKYVDLLAKVNLVRDLIEDSEGNAWQAPAASLARYLIQPLVTDSSLGDVQHLYLVPHNILNYLPFSLLPTNPGITDAVLVDDFALSYLPAAGALIQTAGQGGDNDSLLAMAPMRSRLKHAIEEARTISGLYEPESTLLTGEAATESAFKEKAGGFGVLHLSTHGYFNARNPLLSGLELEADQFNDGFLEVHEISEMHLSAGLVTLSACETGLASGYFNQIPAGDDFVGLTRAFLLAGSRSVLASLWKVDDRSTVALMKDFYIQAAMDQSTANRAVALAKVQRKMRSSRQYNHPFYWAPFVLVGSQSRNTINET